MVGVQGSAVLGYDHAVLVLIGPPQNETATMGIAAVWFEQVWQRLKVQSALILPLTVATKSAPILWAQML